DEIVAIKGGHVMDRETLRRRRPRIAESYLQVEDGFFVGARRPLEVRRNKLFINHSCEPNLGIRGQLTFLARRPSKARAKQTYDGAMEENSGVVTRCSCGTPRCRKRLTGRDWTIPALQRRYRGYFAAYLEAKMGARRRRRS